MTSHAVSKMTLPQLLETCEKRFLTPEEVDDDTYAQARARLFNEESPELLAWAQKLLDHENPDAWECGAGLIGRLGETGRIPRALVSDAVKALDEVVRRPARTDGKGITARASAIEALGHLRAMRVLVAIAQLRAIKNDEVMSVVKRALERCGGKSFTTMAATLKWARALVAREKQSHEAWAASVDGKAPEDFTAYPTDVPWSVGDLLDHPKFGHGVVTKIADSLRMEILFRDGPRTLTQGGSPTSSST